MKVYVLDKNKRPLMPCEPVIARLLLKKGKAKVYRRTPFTIKLNYVPEKVYLQPCTIGVDSGSGIVGSAAVTDDGKVLYMANTEVRNDIRKKMDARRKYRRTRRTRKTRYRAARFKNRGNSKRKGRLSPTMQSKIHTHEKEVAFIRKLLPCKKVVIETGTFDPALLNDPRLHSNKVRHWGYQKGPNYGFANRKAAVLNRDSYTCQHCKGKSRDSRLEVHHIVWRSNGGSDDMTNLITMCKTCHSKIHSGEIVLKLKGKAKGALLHATQMNIIRSRLLKKHPDWIETFGYITKENRQQLGLEKDHCIDATVIAFGGNPLTFVTQKKLHKVCIPEGDFARTKGRRSETHIPKGKMHGFLRYDKVRYLGREYFVKGRFSTGYAILMDINGKKVEFKNAPSGIKTPKMSLFKRIGARKAWMVTEEAVTPSISG